MRPVANNCRGGPPWPPVIQHALFVKERVATEGHPLQFDPRLRISLIAKIWTGMLFELLLKPFTS
jgi:hypothetical protein